ncbi:hypothetical protein GL178_11140 [Vibrio toranzoniae]|uniref:hypothetical protein n=1 Tax=Vibrio toranzoniae TaxID=1194427 RepID=UPI001377EFB2|nr:hypothetical protein [Vibrio toranzoniae]NAZ46796.1 hypothetical protein [Vibrio toranzoniae]
MSKINIYESFNRLEYKYPNRKDSYIKVTKKKSLLYIVLLPIIILFYILIGLRNRFVSRSGLISKKALIGKRYYEYVAKSENIIVVMESIYNINKFFFKKNVIFFDYEFINCMISLGLRYESKFITMILKRIQAKYNIEELVFFTDYQPLYKAIINSARSANIKTMSIQHGIYSGLSPSKYEIDGYFVDRFITYDEHQRNICIEAGLDSRRISIGGVPDYFRFNTAKALNPTRKVLRICILGSGYRASGKDSISERINNKLLDKLNLCKNLEVFYKPHPLELVSGNIEITNVDANRLVKGSLENIIGDFDVFVGVGSTALLQASVNQKISIQIMPQENNIRQLNKFCYCYSFEENDFNWIRKIKDLEVHSIQTSSYEKYLVS